MTEILPDQTGNTALITGGNSGIGFEAARMLKRAGATVVIACRDPGRAGAALRRLQAEPGHGDASVLPLDLASLTSVREAVQRFCERHERLDLLINNAGVMGLPRMLTPDGFEMHIGVNHFGHFAFTGGLLDSDLRAYPARIVNVSSFLHRRGQLHFEDLEWSHGYDRWVAYGTSKLANLLFSFELARRLRARGIQTASVACHPGYARTNLHDFSPASGAPALERWAHRLSHALFAQSAHEGAWPTVHAATAAGVKSAEFYGPDGFAGFRGKPTCVQPSAPARDPQLAARLWEVSVERTGARFVTLDAPTRTSSPAGAPAK